MSLTWLDNQHLEERNHRHSQEERHHQVDGNGNGELFQSIVDKAMEGLTQ